MGALRRILGEGCAAPPRPAGPTTVGILILVELDPPQEDPAVPADELQPVFQNLHVVEAERVGAEEVGQGLTSDALGNPEELGGGLDDAFTAFPDLNRGVLDQGGFVDDVTKLGGKRAGVRSPSAGRSVMGFESEDLQE